MAQLGLGSKHASLSEVAALLSDHRIGCLPVLDGDLLVGILTEGDFVTMLRAANFGPTE
jgi:CBS domain-containing membrane protein